MCMPSYITLQVSLVNELSYINIFKLKSTVTDRIVTLPPPPPPQKIPMLKSLSQDLKMGLYFEMGSLEVVS